MTTERTCPHCGGVVAADLNVCPHCARPLPVPSAQAPPPPVTPVGVAPGQPPAVGQAPPAAYPPPPVQPTGYYQPPYPPGYLQPPAPGPYGVPPPPPPDDTLAVISLVLSGLGIVCCTCLSILCPVGLILAIISYHRNRSGVAVAALIAGIAGTVLFVATTGWGLYLNAHPEMRDQIIQQMFQQMGIPVPPGFPMP